MFFLLLIIIIGRVNYFTILLSAEANSHAFIMTGDSFELPNSLEDKMLSFFLFFFLVHAV